MPRRNLWLLGVLLAVCWACHWRSNRFGRVLTYALEQIDRRYYVKIDQQQLFEGALKGMVSRLNDDYSEYIPPKSVDEFNEAIHHRFVGVGVEIILDHETKQLTVASPIFDSPAALAGLRPGDRILKIDGKSTQGLSLEDASGLVRGEEGTRVVLTIQHLGDDRPADVPIVRAAVRANTVLGYSRTPTGAWDYYVAGEDHVGYVRVSGFSAHTFDELRQAVDATRQSGLKGLVIDLRDNRGGLLPAAVQISNQFISEGDIVSTRRRDSSIKDLYTAWGDSKWLDFPVAVLVNKYSASASEIVAACLQDASRAKIVGERTYGKGTVQEIIEFRPGQGEMKLTTATYWRPSQRNINRAKGADENAEWGVSPDEGFAVKLDGEPLTRLFRWRQWHDQYGAFQLDGPKPNGTANIPTARTQAEVDPQLAKALEHARKPLAKAVSK
jgi:carboxyl-terminal processing protease